MTSKEWSSQLAGEDEEKETNLKEESPPEEFLTILKTVHYNNHYNHLSWYNLFVGYLYGRRNCPPKNSWK